MKKTFLVLLVFIASLSASLSASAANRDSWIKWYTQSSTYSGIVGELIVPSNVNATNSSVLNFQLGLGDYVESGISYTAGKYKAFINTGYHACKNTGKSDSECAPYWRSEFLNVQPSPGEKITVKIVNNGNSTFDFYVNGSRVINGADWGTRKHFLTIPATTQVKQMHITTDTDGKTHYSNASWQNVKMRANASGSTYTDWNSSTPVIAAHQNQSDFIIHSKYDPLKTSR
ncbi:hypothetical protein [Paenibacillus elgii]|uniref:hypothetical protein n=1 Tax=Paenibacillus elgii TaxID=189691 RepID=UPI000FD6B4AD|nr:hypothetical protein [Paenibacillus elgii]NEN86653.1 hypothetical protein [Paenibacillus elgii]